MNKFIIAAVAVSIGLAGCGTNDVGSTGVNVVTTSSLTPTTTTTTQAPTTTTTEEPSVFGPDETSIGRDDNIDSNAGDVVLNDASIAELARVVMRQQGATFFDRYNPSDSQIIDVLDTICKIASEANGDSDAFATMLLISVAETEATQLDIATMAGIALSSRCPQHSGLSQ